MPRYKITFIFDYGQYGFSESWYLDNTETNLDAIRDRALIVANQRMKLASLELVMKAIRVSNDDEAGRVGKSYYVGLRAPGSFAGLVAAQSGMSPSTAINCQFGTFDNRYQKLLQLRGGWDSWEQNGGQLSLNDPFLTSGFASYQSALIGNAFGFRSISSQVRFNVIDYEVSASNIASISVAHVADPAITLLTAVGPIGTRKAVKFSSVNGKSKLNGTQVGYVVSATEFRLLKPIALGPYVSPGTMSVPSYTVRPIANGSLARIGRRAAGAPLLVSPGRRSALPRT